MCSMRTVNTLAEGALPAELHRAFLGPAVLGGLLLLAFLVGTDGPPSSGH